jgi:hydrogenase/urease accessory protein HupE
VLVARAVAVLGLTLAALVPAAGPASAHRLSPAYFGLTETAPNTFDAQWKVSIPGGLADSLVPKIPDGCALAGEVRAYTVGDARIQHGSLECPRGITGRSISVDGLDASATDVLLRIDFADGTAFTHRLVPTAPSVTIPEHPGAAEVISTYLVLGVEHILLGIDHLLFVLALLLLVDGLRRLVATVTAFTLAHSITLAAATLGFVAVPSAPVESTIALSILFVASELARRPIRIASKSSLLPLSLPPLHSPPPLSPQLPQSSAPPLSPPSSRPLSLSSPRRRWFDAGRPWPPPAAPSASAAAAVRADTGPDLMARFPWLVAFCFGLLHGFGFAGALSDVGLPQRAIPLALLFFNVGVEIGQLLFIAAVLALGACWRRAHLPVPPAWRRFAAYAIGIAAAYWFFGRAGQIFV